MKNRVFLTLSFSLVALFVHAQTMFCGQPVQALITSDNISSLFSPGQTWPTNSVIGVSGTLTVDQSITFDKLTLIMGPGAEIKVTGTGVVLTATPTTLFKACTFFANSMMWNGITVQHGAALNFDNVRVRDAYAGITFRYNAHDKATALKNCTLLNNLCGIQVLGLTLFQPKQFFNVRIEKDQEALLSVPPGKPEYLGSFPLRGIFAVSSTVDLAAGASATNVIEDQRYGMYAVNATVTLANMWFKGQINDNLSVFDTLDGTDIYAKQTTLTIGTGCEFKNAPNTSIFSLQTRGLMVSGARFIAMAKYGIRVTQVNVSTPIEIKENVFELNDNSCRSAIYVERSYNWLGGTNLMIEGNTITQPSNFHFKVSKVMIDVQGKVNANDFVVIKGNSINVESKFNGVNGIRITGKGKYFKILDNINLTWEAPQNPTESNNLSSRGIIAKDLIDEGHEIKGNNIVSKIYEGKSFLRAGIFMDHNPMSMAVCKNIINKTYKGIECIGKLSATNMKENSMGEAVFGLYCEAGNEMPDQICFENLWTASTYGTPTIGKGAKYNAASPPFKMYYDSNNSITNDVPPTSEPAGWFEHKDESNPSCAAAVSFTKDERDFINGIQLPNASAKNWDTRQRLLYKLLEIPELVRQDRDANSYLLANENANSSPYRFAKAEHLFNKAFEISPSLISQLNASALAIQNFNKALADIDMKQALDPNSYDPDLAQDRAEVFEQLSTEAITLEALRAEANPFILAGLQTALDYTLDLPQATPFEENLGDILSIAIRSAQGEELGEADITRLRDIASQCPSEGGLSVRRAPQWLEHEEGLDYLDKDWDEGCVVSYYSEGSIQPNVLQHLQIAPNPVDDYLQVNFPEKAVGEWFISNALGTAVRQGKVDMASLGLNTSDWLPGFYFITWKDDQGQLKISKFIIAH